MYREGRKERRTEVRRSDMKMEDRTERKQRSRRVRRMVGRKDEKRRYTMERRKEGWMEERDLT